MKRIKLHLSACLLLAGSAAFVSSCQDYEPFSEERVQDVAYVREFERQFGEIDPNQNWDLFGQLAQGIGPVTRALVGNGVDVTHPDTEFSSGEEGVANGYLKVDEEKNQQYAKMLPEDGGTRRGNTSAGQLYYYQTNLGRVTQNFVSTAREFQFALVHAFTDGISKDHVGIYWYTDEDGEGVEDIFGSDGVLYHIKKQSIYDLSDCQHIEYYYPNNGNPLTQNFSSNNMSAPFGWSATYFLTPVYKVTIPSSIPSYGFWIKQDGAGTKYSEPKLNDLVTITDMASHTDQSYVATFNLKSLDPNSTDDTQYLCFEDWMGGDSNFDLNDIVFGVWGIDETTIIDRDAINEQAILVCEDLNTYDFDFNDIALGLHYKEQSGKAYEYNTVTKEYTVTEDETKKKKTLTITAMAAGGAFESTVKFNTVKGVKEFGKIHELMGETGVTTATGHAIINAREAKYPGDGEVYTIVESHDASGNLTTTLQKGSTPVETVSEDAVLPSRITLTSGANKYPTYLSQLFGEGFFQIFCTQGNSTNSDGVSAEKLLTNGQYKDYTSPARENYGIGNGIATVPQMMLLPYYFEWPREEVWIANAYEGFSDWVSDITATNWIYDTQAPGNVVDRGNFTRETEINSGDSSDPGSEKETFTISVQSPVNFTFTETVPPRTYNHAVYIDLHGILINEGASGVLKINYKNKPTSTIYIDDANGNELYKDHSGYDPIGYPLTPSKLSQAIASGGIYIMNYDDEEFEIEDAQVILEVVGVTDPDTRHTLTVENESITFTDSNPVNIGAQSDATTITYTSTNEDVAIVDASGKVTPVADGQCVIVVKAEKGENDDKEAATKRVTVYVSLGANSSSKCTVDTEDNKKYLVQGAGDINGDAYIRIKFSDEYTGNFKVGISESTTGNLYYRYKDVFTEVVANNVYEYKTENGSTFQTYPYVYITDSEGNALPDGTIESVWVYAEGSGDPGGSSETNLTVTQTGTLEHNYQDTEYTITGPASALTVGATLSFEIEGDGNGKKADCYTADNKGGTQLINNGNSVTLTQAMIDAISVSGGTFTIYAITWGGETLKSATITPKE